jgi:hypothetical protein
LWVPVLLRWGGTSCTGLWTTLRQWYQLSESRKIWNICKDKVWQSSNQAWYRIVTSTLLVLYPCSWSPCMTS